MTVKTQNNSASDDNTCQAILIFKKPSSTSSTSLANGKSYYSKDSHFSVIGYK